MGFGSGGGKKKSDEQKKREGTFRPDRSEEARIERQAAKIIGGPWLSDIPKPELQLNETGKKKYEELAKMLLDQNKLTMISRMTAETAAMMFQKIQGLTESGKMPTASDITQYQRALSALGLAENAKPIASVNQLNKYEHAGFSTRGNAAFRVRQSTEART